MPCEIFKGHNWQKTVYEISPYKKNLRLEPKKLDQDVGFILIHYEFQMLTHP